MYLGPLAYQNFTEYTKESASPPEVRVVRVTFRNQLCFGQESLTHVEEKS